MGQYIKGGESVREFGGREEKYKRIRFIIKYVKVKNHMNKKHITGREKKDDER